MTSKFTRIEFPGSLRLGKYLRSVTRIIQPKISLNSRKCGKWQF